MCCAFCNGMSAFFTLFFFFQAEDGIRDVAVTGVQTCALPISICVSHRPGLFTERYFHHGIDLNAQVGTYNVTPNRLGPGLSRKRTCTVFAFTKRSEERRVGKEWRYGWSRGQ